MPASHKRRKKPNLARNLVFTILIISAALYIAADLRQKVMINMLRTSVLELGSIEKSAQKDVVIIRKQKRLLSPADGSSSFFVQNGQRVAKNAVIAKINTSPSSVNDMANLKMLNRKIEQLSRSGLDHVSGDQKAFAENQIDKTLKQIQYRIGIGDTDKLIELKDALFEQERQRQELNSAGSGKTPSLADLIEQKNNLVNKINSSGNYVKAPTAGEVSFYTDEYDEVFTKENMMNLSAKDILNCKQHVKKLQSAETKKGDVLCSIVDNHMYYMACEINKGDIDVIKRDVPIKIKVDGTYLQAYFYDFYKDKQGRFIGLFSVDSDNYDFLQNRKKTVEIIYSDRKGILIPKEAIILKNGKRGAFIVSKIGTAEFKYIDNIISEDEDWVLKAFNYNDMYNTDKINLYDEVILSSKNVKEGSRVR